MKAAKRLVEKESMYQALRERLAGIYYAYYVYKDATGTTQAEWDEHRTDWHPAEGMQMRD